jgi:hypothetical protein
MTRSFFKILKMSAAGLVGAIGVLAVTLKKTIGYGMRIRQEMAATGRTAKDVLRVREAFRLVGVEGDEVMGIMDDMQERIADFRRYGSPDVGVALKMIGLGFDDLMERTNRGRDTQKTFQLIMTSLEDAKLSAQDLKWALDKLFGGKGMELADLAANFSSHMATAKENTDGLAESLSKELEAMEEVHKAMGKFQATMRKVGFSIVSRIPLKEIAEAVKGLDVGALIDGFTKFLKDPIQGIKDFWEWLKTDVLKFITGQVLPVLFGGLQPMLEQLKPGQTNLRPDIKGLHPRVRDVWRPGPGAAMDTGKKVDETNEILGRIYSNMNKGASFA